MTEPDKPSILERLRTRYHWLDRVLAAQDRYNDCQGKFYAAGLTYFTIFAIFPLLMEGFAIGGLVLSRRPELLTHIEERIRTSASATFGQQLIDLIDAAIESRTSVGIIGLAVAGWAGLSWMAKLREALSQMWESPGKPPGLVRAKLSDLVALILAFVASVITLGLTALGDPAVMASLLRWAGVPHISALGGLLRAASLAMSLLVSWLLFTWMIAWLPRVSGSLASSMQAGLIAAVGFEVLKQVASIFLRSVVNSPAGIVFGPVLGLMVFAYITARLILMATAWAATSPDNLSPVLAEPPPPVLISPRVQVDPGLRTGQALAAAVVGAVGALGFSRWFGRR